MYRHTPPSCSVAWKSSAVSILGGPRRIRANKVSALSPPSEAGPSPLVPKCSSRARSRTEFMTRNGFGCWLEVSWRVPRTCVSRPGSCQALFACRSRRRHGTDPGFGARSTGPAQRVAAQCARSQPPPTSIAPGRGGGQLPVWAATNPNPVTVVAAEDTPPLLTSVSLPQPCRPSKLLESTSRRLSAVVAAWYIARVSSTEVAASWLATTNIAGTASWVTATPAFKGDAELAGQIRLARQLDHPIDQRLHPGGGEQRRRAAHGRPDQRHPGDATAAQLGGGGEQVLDHPAGGLALGQADSPKQPRSTAKAPSPPMAR